MIIYNLDYSEYKILNPVTNEKIVDEECNDDAKSLIAYWLDGYMSEPVINDAKLQEAWEAFAERYEEDNDESPYWEHLYKFLVEYDSSEWIGYEITSYGIACGPICSTMLYVVDKDVVVEEADREEMD
jgi:hypothetical protein